MFAGSASVADAIIQLNEKDNGKRKFICIQLPENVEEGSEAKKYGFDNIAQISRARIKKVIERVNKNFKSNTLFQGEPLDLGFKSFTLSNSNFKIWNSSISKAPEAIQQQLFNHVDHVNDNSKQESILTELLLKSGFELTTRIEILNVAGKEVYSIADGELLICLEKDLSYEVIKEIAEMQPSRVVCLDEGFTGESADALKTNAVQIMKSKGVLNFRTI
jgi:adenine-specific DNA-methyltransferase